MDIEEPTPRYIESIEEHRLYLRDVNFQNQRDRDRTVLGFAGGSLVLSVTFLSQIVSTPGWKWMLGIAWTALLVSMVAVVASYPAADRELERTMAAVDEWLTEPTSRGPEVFRARISPKLNLLGPAMLVLGLVFLSMFAFLNLS